MRELRIVQLWDDDEAKPYFQLERFVPYDENHSCYGCYDDWPRNRKKCSSNKDHWEFQARGAIGWAKTTNKHYKIGAVI